MRWKSAQEYVAEVIETVLLVDQNEITPQARLCEDLGADSLDQTEILMALEDDCEIVFDADDKHTLLTVEQIVSAVERKMKENGRTNTE